MPPKKTSGSSTKKNATPKASKDGLQLGGSKNRAEKGFESDLAMEIIGELYPLLLENCTDDDDEIDTQAVFEVLAGMMGLFIADYRSYYGHEKAMSAMQDLVDMALNLYEERE